MPRPSPRDAYFLVLLATTLCGRVQCATHEFLFPRSECLEGTFSDTGTAGSAIGNLKRDSSLASCVKGLGVKSTSTSAGLRRVVSTADATALNDELDGDGFAIEMWFQPDQTTMDTDTAHPILTLGKNASSAGSSDYSIRITQTQQKLEWSSNYNGALKGDSAEDVVPSDAASTQTHLVVNMESSIVKIYINGAEAAVIACCGISSLGVLNSWSDNDLTTWEDDYTLSLFDNLVYGTDAAWAGTIYTLKIHDTALTTDEISTAYAAKLANSPPIASSFSATVQEDGEVGSHYDTPDYYTTEVPVLELATLNLDVYDADEEPSYINYDESDSPMLVYISRLPPASLATLYQYDGTEITSVPTAVPKTEGNYTVRIRPAWNQHSTGDEPFTNFTFYAVDGVTGEVGSTNMASVVVAPKNDPAVAFNSNETVYAARKTLLHLTGTAVEDDTIVRAYISRLPNAGVLYFANETEMGDGVVALSAGDVVELPHGSLYVAYKYTGAQDLPENSDGFIYEDSFGFRLLDSSGESDLTLGTEANYTIHVSVGIAACAISCDSSKTASVQTVTEDVSGTVTLYGKDYSDSPSELTFVITSLPSHGTLTDPETSATLGVGDTLSTTLAPPYSGGVSVSYKSDTDYFNFPSTMYNGTDLGLTPDVFKFKVQTVNATSKATSLSVRVKNSNDAPTLNNASDSYSVYAWGYSDDDTDDPEYATTLEITNVHVDDVDRNVDVVVVYIEANKGLLTLNPNHLAGVDFTGSLYDMCFKYSSWQCKDDGDSAKKMRFIGQPKDVNLALSKLEYKCTTSLITDTVTITVYDGDGKSAGCVEAEDLDDANCCSDRSDGCLTASTSFTVEVLEYAAVAKENSGCSGWCLKLEVWLAIVVSAFGITLMGCVACYARVSRKLRRREEEAAMATDSSDDSSSDDESDEDSEEESEEVDVEAAMPGSEGGKKQQQKKEGRKKKKGKKKGSKKGEKEDEEGAKKKTTWMGCCCRVLLCPIRSLYNVFCCLMCLWCCCQCCATKPKSKNAQEKENEMIDSFKNQKAMRKAVEKELTRRICCLRCYCIRCVVFSFMWAPFQSCYGRVFCCCFVRVVRLALGMMPKGTRKSMRKTMKKERKQQDSEEEDDGEEEDDAVEMTDIGAVPSAVGSNVMEERNPGEKKKKREKKKEKEKKKKGKKAEKMVMLADAEEDVPLDPEEDPSTWEAYSSPDGRQYYYNTVTNVTRWDKPRFKREVVEAMRMKKQQMV